MVKFWGNVDLGLSDWKSIALLAAVLVSMDCRLNVAEVIEEKKGNGGTTRFIYYAEYRDPASY
jgi:hypothetical protein